MPSEGKRLEEIAESKAVKNIGGKAGLARVLGFGDSRAQLYRLFDKAVLDTGIKKKVSEALGRPVTELFPVTGVSDESPDYVILPTWSGGAQASAHDQHATDVAHHDYVRVPRDLFEDAEAVLPVFGNSMTPSYPPGAQLALALDETKFFEYGEVYVLKLKGKVRPLLKRVFESERGDEWITLVSDNTILHPDGPRVGKPMYPPQDIQREIIDEVWEVIGDQKRRKNKAILLRNLREKQYQ